MFSGVVICLLGAQRRFKAVCVLGGAALLVSILLVAPVIAPLAAADTAVEIHGITIPCAGCEKRTEPVCVIAFPAEGRELSCEAAIEELLSAAAAKPEAKRPGLEDLRRYLFLPEATPDTAAAVMRMLAATKAGEAKLAADLGSLVPRLAEALNRYLRAGTVPAAVMEAVFRLPRNQGAEYSRGLAMAIDPKGEPVRLISELPAVDPQTDSEDIIEYARAFREVKPEEGGKLAVIASLVSDCAVSADGELGAMCLSRSLPQGFEKAQRYFSRLRANVVLRRMSAPGVAPEMKLHWLKRLDVATARTPEMLAALRGVVKELLGEAVQEQQKLIDAGELAFVEQASRYDTELASLTGLLLVRYAAAIWDLGSRREAARAVLSSYRIFPEPLGARSLLVERISADLPREEPWFQELWEQLPESAQAELRWAPKHTTRLILGVIGVSLLLLLILGGVVVSILRRPTRGEQPVELDERPVVSVERMAELRGLLHYFELKPPVTEQELTRRYRQKAKILHPDTVSGSREDFNELTNRYQRARTLLEELSRISKSSESSKPGKGGIT